MKPTREEIEAELKKAGWYPLWHPDNWVPPGSSNPDWAGMAIDMAYDRYQKEKKLSDHR